MKMNWKKRAFLFVLSLVVLLPLLSLSAFADEGDFVEWELSDDERTITGNSKVYELYYSEGNLAFYEEAKQLYVYDHMLSYSEDGLFEGRSGTIYAPYEDSEFIMVSFGDGYYIYATEEGARQMDAFLSGKTDNCFLRSSYRATAKLDPSVLDAMERARKQGSDKITMDVTKLQDLFLFEVIVYDQTETFAYDVGAVYRLSDGNYYYLHYLSLGNQYFDADGNFSYRSGSVELICLDASIAEDLAATAEKIEYAETLYIWENDGSLLVPTAVFWVLYAFIGFVLPIAPLVVGLVLPHSKKMGYPKYWYILSVIAAIWIFLAILLMILLI